MANDPSRAGRRLTPLRRFRPFPDAGFDPERTSVLLRAAHPGQLQAVALGQLSVAAYFHVRLAGLIILAVVGATPGGEEEPLVGFFGLPPGGATVMWSFFKQLLRQNYSVIILILGAFLAGVSCITVSQKDTYLLTHAPTPVALFVLGTVLILVSVAAFAHSVWRPPGIGGLDLSAVKESRGIFSTTIGGCEIRVVKGKLEDYTHSARSAVVLPCNEYFDDECAADTRSAFGAYVNSVFKNRCAEFVSLVREECPRVFGPGVQREKTKAVHAVSFGVGLCLLLDNPLGHRIPVALLSTTTQLAQEGLVGSVSYLFDGMKNLFRSMADARLNEVAMPLLGSGHGGVDRPLAFVGLLIAIAEAARRGHGGHRERKVTIVIYKKDKSTPAEVDDMVIRRGLALIGSKQANTARVVPARHREAA